MILVQLRVQSRNLPLPEGVVERFVDHFGRNAHARSGHAVDHKRGRQSRGLLVGRYVAKLRQPLQLLHELCRPRVQFVLVGIFERVLILRAAYAVLDRQILHRLHVQSDAFHVFQLGL